MRCWKDSVLCVYRCICWARVLGEGLIERPGAFAGVQVDVPKQKVNHSHLLVTLPEKLPQF